MTIEEARKELNSCRSKLLEAQGLAEIVADYFRDITAPIREIIKVSGGKNKKPFTEDRIEDYFVIKEKYETKRNEAYNKALNIIEKIDRIQNPYKDILRMRYVETKKLEEISLILHYNYRWLQRLLAKAIRYYAELKTKQAV